MLFHRSFAFLFLGIISASAQEPADNETPEAVTPPAAKAPGIPPINRRPIPPPGVPIPGAIPAAAAGAPAVNEVVRQPGVPLGQTKIVGGINEPKLSGNALAGLYRIYTGRRVIVSASAATAEFSFVQDSTPEEPLIYDEAAALLRKAALLEGFVFVPDEQNPNWDILTLSTGGTRPPGIGLRVYNENDTLPEGDAVIHYVMTLSYIKPAEAVNTFTQIIGQFGTYGSISAVANASAIVITENTSLIRKLIDLKKEIDKPGSVQGTRFIKVQYADVTEIATTLTDLLTAQQSAQKTAGIQRADGAAPQIGGAPPVAGQPSGGAGGEESPVQIIPDPRTNRIFAMGRPVDLLFVEGLVREFDVETSEKNFLRRKLRFLTVSEFLPVASDALTRAFTSGTNGASGGGASGAGAQGSPTGGGQGTSRSQSSGRQSSGNSRSNGSTGANFGGSGGGLGGGSFGSSGGGGSGGSALEDPNASSAPQSVLVGRTLLVADNITNSIVVQGPPSGLEIIERLLDQIDVKPDQVLISTVIGQLTLDDSHKFGVDYLSLGGDVIGGAGGGLRRLIDIPAVGTPGTPGFIPATKGAFDTSTLSGSSGLRVFGKIGDNLSVYLEALQSKSDFTVLSRPSIYTSNNQKGTISSGERIAIPTGSNSFGTGNSSSTQIEYQDVVLKLEVIPLVNSDNEITMQIALLNDEQNGTQTIAGGGGNGTDLTVPRISTREILTTVTVPNNETIVLGGLIVSRGGKDKSGIPILSSIPYIGGLFGSTSDSKTRSELLVFLQPSVVKNDRSLNAVQADIDNRYKVSGPTRGMGDGPGVLPPVDAITPVEDKGGSRNARSKPYVSESQSPPIISTMKPSIQPANRK